jgi:phosphatidylserine/phosphatidylglycerophosphate/cardiolipin synthase-like enzyme
MRRFSVVPLLLLLLLLPACRRSEPTVEVHFSPKGGCTEAIVAEIGAAKESVLVQAYSFTSAPIAKALVEAHKRGVDVQVVLDKGQKGEKYSSADFVANARIPVRIDSRHAIAHNKVMVIDGETVVTGSFNFTKSAEESNAENLLIIRDPCTASRYAANWQEHAKHSEPYEGKAGAEAPDSREESSSVSADAGDPAADGYVSSANSAVFHRAGCDSAAKIAVRNRVGYNTRGEAIAAGKRPCQECKP